LAIDKSRVEERKQAKKAPAKPPPMMGFGMPSDLIKADMWYVTTEGNIAGNATVTSSMFMFNPTLGD
jgi:hypothetical protein